MISQGAMALGGVIWGLAGAILGTSSALVAAAGLLLASLFLARRLSINFAEGPQKLLPSGRIPVCSAANAELRYLAQ
jgi:hypothetical protein